VSPLRPRAGAASRNGPSPVTSYRGSGSSPATSYYKDPQESVSQVIFRPKTAKPSFLGCLLREIFACNRVAAAKAVRTNPYFTQ
jgi:hypothetical protein